MAALHHLFEGQRQVEDLSFRGRGAPFTSLLKSLKVNVRVFPVVALLSGFAVAVSTALGLAGPPTTMYPSPLRAVGVAFVTVGVAVTVSAGVGAASFVILNSATAAPLLSPARLYVARRGLRPRPSLRSQPGRQT